jgi:hypothetical protein
VLPGTKKKLVGIDLAQTNHVSRNSKLRLIHNK